MFYYKKVLTIKVHLKCQCFFIVRYYRSPFIFSPSKVGQRVCVCAIEKIAHANVSELLGKKSCKNKIYFPFEFLPIYNC